MSDKINARWGRFGRMIQNAGAGGGFVTLPYIMDTYERALGYEPLETWFIKRLLRNLWVTGKDVFPSLAEMEREANISVETLKRLRSQLETKGHLKNNGRVGGMDNRIKIDLLPFFDALFICVVCDPNSTIVKHDNHSKVREYLFGQETYSRYFEQHISLPLSLTEGRELAERLGVSLDWSAIAKMQGNLTEVVNKDMNRHARQMKLKNAIHEAIEPYFSIRWQYKRAWNFLKWLVDSEYTTETLSEVALEYCETVYAPDTHTVRNFENHVKTAITVHSCTIDNTAVYVDDNTAVYG